MPTPTYDLIEEKVLSSAAPSVTFNSIPGTYRDLVIECVGAATAGSPNLSVQYNSDTATNYSCTYLSGNGTAASSGRQSTQAQALFSSMSPAQSVATLQVFSYTSTAVYKTAIGRGGGSDDSVNTFVTLWRKTPEAITSIKIATTSSTFITGSTFRLWGIA